MYLRSFSCWDPQNLQYPIWNGAIDLKKYQHTVIGFLYVHCIPIIWLTVDDSNLRRDLGTSPLAVVELHREETSDCGRRGSTNVPVTKDKFNSEYGVDSKKTHLFPNKNRQLAQLMFQNKIHNKPLTPIGNA